jgi:cell division protein FtsI (penicillin-binding protein 3)
MGYLPEVKRIYPNGSLASHVVGFVGIDNQPLEGIELKYDEQLRGRDESVQILKDARGRTLSDGRDFLQGGNSLVLTLDAGLQYILETELDNAYKQWDALSASAIMMNPYTGEILAMANRPTYDLNRPSSYKTSDRRNRAITDSYEPGSTFKVITAAAVLEEGLVTPSTSFDCSKGYVKVGKKAIWDTHNMGVLTFREVIRSSSNVGTVMASMGLQNKEFREYMKRFGFGSKTGIDLNGESRGKVRPISKWSGTALASASIGYGVAVTPLQILRAYSAVANGGVLPTPHIVSEIVSPRGDTIFRFQPSEQNRAISTRTAQTLKDILISVTQEGGTATQAVVDGNRVAGKTGTARLLDEETGEYSTEKYSSSFVGFAPADKPEIALVVLIYEPKGKYYGGQVAAPVFKDIVDKSLSYMKVPREDNFDNNVLLVHARGF